MQLVARGSEEAHDIRHRGLGPAQRHDVVHEQDPEQAGYCTAVPSHDRGSPPSPLRVSLCVICHDRPAELRSALASAAEQTFDEIVVVDNASTPALEPVAATTWVRADYNAGVAAGRNLAAAHATGDILVFLDDDAVFLRDDVVDVVRSAFDERATLGALAGRILRPDGLTVPHEHPFRGPVADADEARPCAYVVGAVHAVRRQAWDQAGGLDGELFYSTEEVDLAFTLVRLGWALAYEPRLLVEHRPSPRGRLEDPALPALRWRNRLVLVRRHLPWPVAMIHAALWCYRTVVEARATGQVGPWLRAWRSGLTRSVERRPLTSSECWRQHRLGGRILY